MVLDNGIVIALESGIIKGAQKIVVYGPEGIGKTTFASRFPNPVFIDTEGSTKHIDVKRLPKPTSWMRLLETITYVKNNSKICDTLVIDTADWAERLCVDHICDKAQKTGIEDFGYGKGYVYLAEEFGKLLNALTELIESGINVVLVAHAQMRKFDLPEETGSFDRWELKLGKKTAPLVKEWADMVLFANYRITIVNVDGQGTEKGRNKAQGGKRVMHTTHHPCWDAKNRHGLAEELPFDYGGIAHCFTSEKQTAMQEAATREQLQDAQASEEKEFQDWLNKEPAPNPEQETKQKSESLPASALPTQPSDGIPKALADLMNGAGVTVAEIQAVVAKKGYYPVDTPISKYDPKFINGVLVSAWPQVKDAIMTMRGEQTA